MQHIVFVLRICCLLLHPSVIPSTWRHVIRTPRYRWCLLATGGGSRSVLVVALKWRHLAAPIHSPPNTPAPLFHGHAVLETPNSIKLTQVHFLRSSTDHLMAGVDDQYHRGRKDHDATEMYEHNSFNVLNHIWVYMGCRLRIIIIYASV